MRIIPSELKRSASYALAIASIVPRPIAWISTLNSKQQPNLAPFSFFTAITNDPFTLIVSIGRRQGRRKDTANNLLAHPEAVVHIPTKDNLHTMVLSSTDYDASINEFDETGLTPIASDLVSPFRIKELPLAMECTVVRHDTYGNDPNDLFFLEVVCMHWDDVYLNEKGVPITKEFDALGRLGHGDYTTTHNDIHSLPRPRTPDAVKDGSWPPPKRT